MQGAQLCEVGFACQDDSPGSNLPCWGGEPGQRTWHEVYHRRAFEDYPSVSFHGSCQASD